MRWLLAVCLVAACSRAGSGEAEEPDEDPPGAGWDEDEAPFRAPRHVPEPEALPLPTDDLAAAYEIADRAYADGRYVTAVGYFKSIYERHPYPEMLYNIAQALRQLDDCYGAAKYYELYLAAAPEAKNRAQVETRLGDLRLYCPAD